MKCALCEDTGWVCENHPDTPWNGEHARSCGSAGMRPALSAIRATSNDRPADRQERISSSVKRVGVTEAQKRPQRRGATEAVLDLCRLVSAPRRNPPSR
jgi:hypothetical protein